MTEALISHEQERIAVKPSADIVAATLPEVRAALRDAIGKGAQVLVVDLSNTQMVDSMGIGLLISAHNSISKLGGRLEVVNASDEILALFKTMRMHQHFSVTGK